MKNNFWAKVGLVILGIFAGWWLVTKFLGFLIGTVLFKFVLPVAIVGALGYAGYRYVTRDRALPGRRRTPLP